MNFEHIHACAQTRALDRKRAIVGATCISLLVVVAVIGLASLALSAEWLTVPLALGFLAVCGAWIVIGSRLDNQIQDILGPDAHEIY